MKNLKLKLGLLSLLAVIAVSVFMTSCEQTISTIQTEADAIVDNSLLTEDELLAKLQADEDAMGLATAMEEFEQIMGEALNENNASVNILRSRYETKDEEGLEELFRDTELLAVYDRIEYHANRFVEKFPRIEEDLSKFVTYQPTSIDTNQLPFATLEANMEMRGCGCCWNANYWGKLACKALCIANGVSCAGITSVSVWGPYICALAGFTCTEFCDWYYCDFL